MGSDPGQLYSGVFSDGESASGQKLLVRFEAEGLEVLSDRGERQLFWSYGQLQSSDPLDQRGPANLGNKTLPDARLYVADQDFAAGLLDRAPQLSVKAERKRVLVPIYLLLLALAAGTALFWMSSWSPSRMIADMMPDGVRDSLGKQVVSYLTGNKPACSTPEGSAALNKMVARLNTGLPRKQAFDVQVARLGMKNAFAAPGEQIVASAQLVRFTHTPEELAGVIAHEMGHGLERHPETGLVRSVGISALIDLISGGNAGNIGSIGGFLLQLSYSRTAEREADAHAIRILRAARLPAHPFADFFDKLRKEQEEVIKPGTTLDRALSLLSTHPSLPERVETIKKNAGYATKPLLTDVEWQALRNICGSAPEKKKPKKAEKTAKPAPESTKQEE